MTKEITSALRFGETLIAIAIVLLLVSCASAAGPESKVLAYLRAEALNDQTSMQALVEPGQSPDPNWVAAQIGNHVQKVDLKKVSTTTTALDRDRVRVHVSGQIHYTFDNPVDLPALPDSLTVPFPIDRSFVLIKLDGNWYIQPENGE